MKSTEYRKSHYHELSIDATHSGNGTVAAVLIGDKIIVDITALGSGENVIVDTPFGFEIIDAYLRVANGGNVNSKTLTVQNGSTAVSSDLSMATDKSIKRATTIDSAEAAFVAGDDDLKLVSSAHADGSCKVVLTIVEADRN